MALRGLQISKRLVLLKAMHYSGPGHLAISLYDFRQRGTYKFLIENPEFSVMTTEDIRSKVENMPAQIEFCVSEQKWLMGMSTDDREDDQLLGIKSYVQPTTPKSTALLKFGATTTYNDTASLNLKSNLPLNEIAEDDEALKDHTLLYSGTRTFGNVYYRVLVMLNKEHKAVIQAKREAEDDRKAQCVIDYNLQSYLRTGNKTDKQTTIGMLIYNWVTINSEGNVCFNSHRLSQFVDMEIMKARQQSMTKLQCRFRLTLARGLLTQVRLSRSKKAELKLQFCLKLGKAYHFIKVVQKIADTHTLFIRSNKTPHELALPISHFVDLTTSSLSGYSLLASIKRQLRLKLGYLPAKNTLVYVQSRAETDNRSPLPDHRVPS